MVVVLSLFRYFFLIFAVFCYVCLLSISSIASQRVLVSVEQPYITETTTTFSVYGVENFDGLSEGTKENYESNFNAPGYEEWCRGDYNDAESDTAIRGIYSSFSSASNGLYGGVGPAGGLYISTQATVLKITHAGPDGINYFGFHGESLNPDNRVELYSGDDRIFELDMGDIINYVKQDSKYMFNPNPEQTERKPFEAFVYVNIYVEGATFDSVQLHSTTQVFESDVHTLGFSTKKPDTIVPITTQFRKPKDFTPVTRTTTEAPARFCPLVKVTIEDPHISITTVGLSWWHVLEDFEWFPLGDHDVYLPEFDSVAGTYSNFGIQENNQWGGAAHGTRFFTARDSWLNITITEDETPAEFFGAYVTAVDPENYLEFYLKDERVFVFYLVDLIDFVQNKPLYFGNPQYPNATGAVTTQAFMYMNIFFRHAAFDAVRFRDWRPVSKNLKMFESDNHIFGHYYDYNGIDVLPIRTIPKIKKGTDNVELSSENHHNEYHHHYNKDYYHYNKNYHHYNKDNHHYNDKHKYYY